MRPISHRTLLRKSRNSRNERAFKLLAEIDSLREWANLPIPEPNLPIYKKCENIANNAGWWNLLTNALKDGAMQLRP